MGKTMVCQDTSWVDGDEMLICDCTDGPCGNGCHVHCCIPTLSGVPDGDWQCAHNPGGCRWACQCTNLPVSAPCATLARHKASQRHSIMQLQPNHTTHLHLANEFRAFKISSFSERPMIRLHLGGKSFSIQNKL